MSATPDSTFATPEQRIADLERQLAERDAELAERDAALAEALEQQAATAEVLGVINASPGNLAPVFEAMLDKAMNLCGATYGGLSTFDGDCFHLVASRGHPEYDAWLRQRGPLRPAPGSMLARIVGGEDAVQIPDIADDELYRSGASPGRRALADIGGFHTLLIIALRKDNILLGAIGAYRQEIRPFTDKQIALLNNFAAQAVIAMENARLITETREALDQQTATAEVLGVINSSPGDLAPVFDAMLEKAVRLCDGITGALWTFEGGRGRLAATRGLSAEFIELLREAAESRANVALERVLAGERLIEFPDILVGELFQAGDSVAKAAVAAGLRSLIWVALVKEGAALGAFVVGRPEVHPFTDKEIALLQNFAAQAVIAMENARLITETREALEQQTATAEVLGVINASPGDLAPVFDAILDKAHTLCGAAIGALLTFDGESFGFLARKVPADLAELTGRPFKPGPQNRLNDLIRGEPLLHIPDARKVAALAPEDPQLRATVELGGMRTFLAVPLRKDDRLIGAITAARQVVQPFSEKQIALLQNFAAQAVIAMENARLLTDTREALERQTATAEILRVISGSPTDLQPTLDAIAASATILSGAANGAVSRFDGSLIHFAAHYGWTVEEIETVRRDFPRPPGPQSTTGRAILTRDVVHVPDITADPEYALQSVLQTGMRTGLSVPILQDGNPVGAITVTRREVEPFSQPQIDLLKTFADQAAIAIENVRLFEELESRNRDLGEALEQQTATAEVLQVINSSPGDLAPVFEAILEKAHTRCGAALGGLVIFDGEEFRPVAVHAEPSFAEYWRQHPVRPPRDGNSPLAGLVRGDPLVHYADVRVGDAYRDLPAYRDLMDRGGIRTLLIVPLRKDGALLGAITAYRREVRPFTDKQIALMENFAAQAVIAMENARLLGELRQRTEEVAELNHGLEARVAEQVEELGRVGRLKRFLAPQLAELIVSQGDEKILESHRREIVVVFCDLRGYTAFTETAEPEEVLDFLREYHGALGPLVSQFEGTLDQFSGDGIMVFFNDPVPIPDPAERAVKMAVAMREAAATLIAALRRRRGRILGFGAGVAQGYATLGQIGFSERSGYTAIGTVCNLAARLCAEAKDGQILVAQSVAVAVEETTPLEEVGELALKGLTHPVLAYNVPRAASQPTLRVIEGGPSSG